MKKNHARVLALWAFLNLTTSSVFVFTSHGTALYFFYMNASWGIINFLIAAFIFYHHNHDFVKPLHLLQQMDYQRHAEKVIAFNIGLDVAFIIAGFAVYRYRNGIEINYPGIWEGFGTSIIVQGTFLLFQDCIFYSLHVKNRLKALSLWQMKLGQPSDIHKKATDLKTEKANR